MTDWVLILVLVMPGGSVSTPSIQVNPIYFHDKAACEGAIAALQESHDAIKFSGKCLPTKSEL